MARRTGPSSGGSSSGGSSSGGSGPGTRVAAARDRIVRGVLSPFNAVLITRKSIEEVVEDAVKRGRMTRADAQDIISSLLARGARVTDELLGDVERLLGNSAAFVEGESGRPAQLPIEGYDDLSAAQVQERIDGLTRAELSRLRDYEQRNANRKTVLERIDRKLR
jgi:polyhydroxyalkanoate synthesis regulator phasin